MFRAILWCALSLSSYANSFNFKTFEAEFLQTIVDENAKKITYVGKIYLEGASKALWHYSSPVQKNLYFLDNTLTMVEPELEQAIIKKIDSDINIYKIIQNAQKIDENNYEANVYSKRYQIRTMNNTVEQITYVDDFGNSVSIAFENQKVDQQLAKETFAITIPSEFDIIRQ